MARPLQTHPSPSPAARPRRRGAHFVMVGAGAPKVSAASLRSHTHGAEHAMRRSTSPTVTRTFQLGDREVPPPPVAARLRAVGGCPHGLELRRRTAARRHHRLARQRGDTSSSLSRLAESLRPARRSPSRRARTSASASRRCRRRAAAPPSSVRSSAGHTCTRAAPGRFPSSSTSASCSEFPPCGTPRPASVRIRGSARR